MVRRLLHLLTAASLVCSCLADSVTLRVEHRWGGGAFADAGSLTASLSSDGSLLETFQFYRTALPPNQLQSFLESATKNQMYTLRVQAKPKDPTSMTVMASVPALCLLTSSFYESLTLEMTHENSVIGMDYRTECQNQTSSVEVGGEDFGFSMEPRRVSVRYPQTAIRLSMDDFLRRQETADGDQPGGKGGPQKQQKTFLQQNWLFLLGGALIIFQLLGAMADPNAGQPNAAPAQVQERR